MTERARAATDLPIVVKLTPGPDIAKVARAVADAGADALTVGGGVPAAAFDGRAGHSRLGSSAAMLSGPAILPIALRAVAEASAKARVPVIGCGGVTTLADVLDMLAAGASAVQVGTAALADPALPSRSAPSWPPSAGAEGSPSIGT